MLTIAQYNALWIHNPLGMGSFATITGIAAPPPYADYVIRENMFEDYLDIFRGNNTRGDIAIRPIVPPVWYYEHPFFNADGIPVIENVPCIKYVLIAEAPPQVNGGVINYIYNLHLPGGNYITAPLNALNINPDGMPTLVRLINLAQVGVLIIDLFPFALDYGDYRCDLNCNGITINFLNNLHNVYSIENRINNIMEEELFCNDFNINNRLNCAFIAPSKTSHFLAGHINLHPHHFLNFRIGHNTFLPLHPAIVIFRYSYFGFPIGTHLVANPGIPNYPITVVNVPVFACTTYNGAGAPSSLFIKNALGL
jgi:hypothetical protein